HQKLHGMGDDLYAEVVPADRLGLPCRVYAPVGSHEDLLPYLVRRLLENGANTSFVNRIADATLPLDELVADPVSAVEALAASEGQIGLPHPRIPLPRELYGEKRTNSSGLDLSNEQRLASLSSALLTSASHPWRAEPIIDAELDQGVEQPVINPAEPGDVVGYVREATEGEVSRALDAAAAAGPI
ncbi:proline dehydrogenase family protein, partial [Pseudomonas aeruginosa]|uniref:proline dehydrogenase family protein n=1 Tax=Pseudomonas aeruginosa TaxID=287 RepID=UPI003BF5FF1D